ncbi:MAG: hypothetical protein LBM87_08465 [Ruminococcus sp.]|jgi:hypothetical protein|nr:hypothetical protein [Ruminococcus sp.]
MKKTEEKIMSSQAEILEKRTITSDRRKIALIIAQMQQEGKSEKEILERVVEILTTTELIAE